MRTQMGIVGAGSAGLTLAVLLAREGIECVILEAREGLVHDGIYLRRQGVTQRIEIARLTGRHVTIYGQQEVVRDLIAAWQPRGGTIHFQVSDVAPHGIESDRPSIAYTHDGISHTLECDFIAGCDGFHGISRDTVPSGALRHCEFVYPFAWLGILAHAAPSTDELIYAWHERGFAWYTMRSEAISRPYVKAPADERLEDCAPGVARAGLLELHNPAPARPLAGDFEKDLQLAPARLPGAIRVAATSLGENYAGLPATDNF